MTPPHLATAHSDENSTDTAPVSLKRILVAVDASDYSDRALEECARLANNAEGVITGIHAYAAQLHDRRFKQMEGGLPERYRQEEEMEYQREVHDDLITTGLNIISDSYHDTGKVVCDRHEVPYERLSPEGKNYTRVVEAARSGDFDVIAMGILGLGAVPGSLIGTVCERVVRRSPIDSLIIKDPKKAIGDGPIVVGLDGSDTSYGCLMTALDLGRRFGCEVHAIAAYDPYYHYVAFNKIATVLSEEAGKVFRFKEQEQLHEELIDDGIAKIYQAHLAVGEKMAREMGVEIKTELLDGKPYKVMTKYLERVKASLLVIGKTGIHADDELDIGGVTENMLRMAPCHLWIGQTTKTPPLDSIAEESIAWSDEAEEMLNRAPEFARGMARKAILRHAHELGHTFITKSIVETVADQIMPGRGGKQVEVELKEVSWSPEAEAMIGTISVNSMAESIRLRAEKAARRSGADVVTASHVGQFMDAPEPDAKSSQIQWSAAALARIARIPEMMRDKTKQRIEAVAAEKGVAEIDMETVEEGLEVARAAMAEAMNKGGHPEG